MTGSPRSLSARIRTKAAGLRRRLPVPATREAPMVSFVPVPDPVPETTHLGPVMDEQVFRAQLAMRPPGEDADYDLLRANFDTRHYLLQTPELLNQRGVDLIEHFLEHGVDRGLSPHPDFSMSNYLGRFPRRAQGRERSPYLAWLKRGRDAGEIADPTPRVMRMAQVLGLPPAELVDTMAERRRDLQDRFRTGTLGAMMAKAAEIEPLIGAAWTEVADPKLLPLSTAPVADQQHALFRAHEDLGWRQARLVLVINRARWGGGRRLEGHLAHALVGDLAPDDIVVIYTDDSTTSPQGRFPDGVRELDFAQLTAHMPKEHAQRSLVVLLRSLRADAIVTINSRMLYHALRTYGRALTATERVFLCFFCNEQSGLGTWEGWSLRYFYRAFDDVAGVITDSEYLAGELTRMYRVTDAARSRIHVFRAPVDDSLPTPAHEPSPTGRPQVFWAGRWDRQKRVPLLLEVAGLMPDVDFRVWGETVMGGQPPEAPANLSIEGRYGHITEIPLAEADAWLYTSGWDGVPSQLLEVAMTGIPIVATQVGGTGEVVSEADAWPVDAEAGAAAYERAIREVLADPGEARRRAAALRERLLQDRTIEQFTDRARRVLLESREGGEGT
ncbi:glycosyltransferase family 4 protein [Nocardioides coralli]|uniref:glycosyltransferase family 4 protein n=1 Tax=Nocardioides coralli TaxID=2872154 RepID=UPI001CA44B4A|nr:glycosyltransferase family 4 protein [Nocardioides coralli]QZY28149.1 glycosyltransferase family 4 protein [Nocardioides coralli]